MRKIRFALEKVEDESTGQPIDTLIKYTKEGDAPETSEPWGNVMEYNSLFDACVSRWGNNWDLNKVIAAINESTLD